MRGVTTICLPLPLRVNTVNCFLLNADSQWLLIDTGCPVNRAELDTGWSRPAAGRVSCG